MARDSVEWLVIQLSNPETRRVARRGTIGRWTCSYIIAWSSRISAKKTYPVVHPFVNKRCYNFTQTKYLVALK